MRENLKFSNTLIMWYLINQRDLPWRKSNDPYLIWLSEIILQQTRIAQGTSYYEKFASEFDDILDLFPEFLRPNIINILSYLLFYYYPHNMQL